MFYYLYRLIDRYLPKWDPVKEARAVTVADPLRHDSRLTRFRRYLREQDLTHERERELVKRFYLVNRTFTVHPGISGRFFPNEYLLHKFLRTGSDPKKAERWDGPWAKVCQMNNWPFEPPK